EAKKDFTNAYVRARVVVGNNLVAVTSASGGMFVSTNNGQSWSEAGSRNSGLSNLYVYSLLVSGNNLFAGTEGGVFVSTNNGQSWSAANNGLLGWSGFVLTVRALVVSGRY